MIEELKYWPTPKDKPAVRLVYKVDPEPDAPGTWTYKIEVHLRDGSTVGCGGTFEAFFDEHDPDRSELEARAKVLDEVVRLLAQELADHGERINTLRERLGVV